MSTLLMAGWLSFVNVIVGSGYTVALTVICLLQYFAYLHRVSVSRREAARFRDEMTGMEATLATVQKDRTLTRYENQILREFVSQTECDKALGLLLRRFIPNTDHGFAAFIQYQADGVAVSHSRGLSEGACARLQIDEPLQERLTHCNSIVLETADLQRSAVWASLGTKERAKVTQLYLLGVGEPGDLRAVLLTTDLFPTGADRRQQVELAERLMSSLGHSLKYKQTLETHKSLLHWTSEMLQLRALADRPFASPLLMIEEFIRQVAEKIGAERASLFLRPQESGTPLKALVRSGEPFQTGVREAWQRHEDTLAVTGLAGNELVQFDSAGLARIGIQSLLGAAVLVPLVQPDGVIGVICFTKGSRDDFSQDEEQLAGWAGEFLGDSILRAINQATVERQARYDGLTQLANRQTFDQRIARDMRTARATGAPCSLLLLDLDRFKSVNDRYGHQAGDQVLRQTAAVLRERLGKMRSSDQALAARYGGEELAVLLPGMAAEGAVRLAESIRAGVEALTIEFEGKTIKVTTSIGTATFPTHSMTPEDLVAAADSALYQAKSTGRNRVGVPESSLV